MLKPEFMSDESDPSVREWQRIMAARAQGHDLSADKADVNRLEAESRRPVWEAFNSRLEEAIERLEQRPLVIECAHHEDMSECAVCSPSDPVNMPDHYTQLPVECIDVTEHFNFTLGNVIKYVWRADHKGKPLEDLRKARFYLDREIARRERNGQ